jgi:hypothetical protein
VEAEGGIHGGERTQNRHLVSGGAMNDHHFPAVRPIRRTIERPEPGSYGANRRAGRENQPIQRCVGIQPYHPQMRAFLRLSGAGDGRPVRDAEDGQRYPVDAGCLCRLRHQRRMAPRLHPRQDTQADGYPHRQQRIPAGDRNLSPLH